jgi:hypothetical protein
MRSEPYDALLYLGDVYPTGSETAFLSYGKTLGSMARKTAPTIGNHEFRRRYEGYFPYWSKVRGRKPPKYYSFQMAGWKILSLNSEIPSGPDSPQARWLTRQLKKPGTCRIAFLHRPPYSATSRGDNTDVDHLIGLLQGHASIVLSGHEHNMQRFLPINGLTHFVSGAGGRSANTVIPDSRLAFGDDTHDGALRLKLQPKLAKFAFVTSNGKVIDKGRIGCKLCRPAPAS